MTLLLSCALAMPALGQRKSDLVTLYNGDRVTGEIKSLGSGVLKLSTDSMGTVNIEWQEIASVESKYHYEIRSSDGVRYFGSLGVASRPGTLKLENPKVERELDWLKVVEIRPVEDTLLDRIDIYLSAGYSFDKASSVTQTSLNSTISYENENSVNTLNARATFTDTDEETTSSSRVNINRGVWTDRSQLFAVYFGQHETNDELGLDHRLSAGTGLVKYLIDTYRANLLASSGLQVITENKSGNGEEQNVELFLSSRFRTWRLNTPKLDVDINLNLFPSLTDSGRLRSDSDVRIRWEIIEDLFFDVTAYGSYDNESQANDEFDYGITTGLGWEY